MNNDDTSPRRRRRMERLAEAAGRAKGLNPRLAASFGMLALAARCGERGAEMRAAAASTPATVAVDITTLDLGGKG